MEVEFEEDQEETEFEENGNVSDGEVVASHEFMVDLVFELSEFWFEVGQDLGPLLIRWLSSCKDLRENNLPCCT